MPDILVQGARGKHKVDVKVTFDKHGIECFWIVECKYWNTPVTKEKIMALRSIVEDCGADRGVIVSKKGFQSGAVRASTKTNITLTSIETLIEYIDDKTKEINELRSKLERFLCPHCGSELVGSEHIDYDEKNSGLVETFECGYQTGGFEDRPCPTSSDFPKLEDFELAVTQEDGRFSCHARPKTKMARRVHLSAGYGNTEEEARAFVVERYEYLVTPPRAEFNGRWIKRSGYKLHQ